MITATGLLGGHAHFLHWGVVQISLANLVVILLMLLVFALAVLVPFPHTPPARRTSAPPAPAPTGEEARDAQP
ncbi:MAG TPA: hypothetical protein VHO01_15335 [Jatrophihabitans sp.]|nr:hypothetical protein [Jatrophihabitans sp.]